MKFYECKKCGNLMVLVEESGIIPVCCGDTMSEVKPYTSDSGSERHVPQMEINSDDNSVTIQVGDMIHPMLNEHYIKWIVLETNLGGYKRYLKPGVDPIVTFKLSDNELPIRAYEFCNIHGLWSKTI